MGLDNAEITAVDLKVVLVIAVIVQRCAGENGRREVCAASCGKAPSEEQGVGSRDCGKQNYLLKKITASHACPPRSILEICCHPCDCPGKYSQAG
jgi:hypothetical protein